MSQNRPAFKSDVAALMNESKLDEATKWTLVALFGKQAAATRCLQEDIRAVPEEASPATFTPRVSENPESEIQDAIAYAAHNGGGRVEVTEDLILYEASKIDYRSTVGSFELM